MSLMTACVDPKRGMGAGGASTPGFAKRCVKVLGTAAVELFWVQKCLCVCDSWTGNVLQSLRAAHARASSTKLAFSRARGYDTLTSTRVSRQNR